jgi:hypothetical protein
MLVQKPPAFEIVLEDAISLAQSPLHYVFPCGPSRCRGIAYQPDVWNQLSSLMSLPVHLAVIS